MPLYSEWYNVDNIGGWNNWNSTWNSDLKIHVAGFLNSSNGSQVSRGSFGNYWSGSQFSTTNGWYLSLNSGNSFIYDNGKAYCFSVRCLKNNCSTTTEVGLYIQAPANPVCQGTSLAFLAIPTNGGTSLLYQWKKNGNSITGATSSIYSYTPDNNDVITCVLTSSQSCVTNNPATSNAITVIVNQPPAVPASAVHTATQNQITWNWDSVAGATGYKWNTVNDYNSAIDLGNSTTHTDTALVCNTLYTRYIWSYNTCGHSDSLALQFSTTACPAFTCGQNLVINHVAGAVAPLSKTLHTEP